VLILEEASRLDEAVFKEVILPLLGVQDTVLLAISTPMDEHNFYRCLSKTLSNYRRTSSITIINYRRTSSITIIKYRTIYDTAVAASCSR